MHTLGKRTVVFALCLSALAGYVDAIGFLETGGMFVSFMSGNSTKLMVGLVQGFWPRAILLAEIIASFVLGAMFGALVALRAGRWKQVAVLALVTALLAAACLCYSKGSPLPAILFMALAMGMENDALQRAGDTTIGVTYMTGTLVKIGQGLARALTDADYYGWFPYFLLWLGLISGGMVGAMLFLTFGLQSLWLGVAWAALMTGVAVRRARGR